MSRQSHSSPGATHLIGLLCVAAGMLPMLGAFDIGPLGREDINGPPWLGFAGGAAFAAAGLALIAGPGAPLASGLFGVLAVAALASIGNWVAFGFGQRACTGSVSLSGLMTGAGLSGLACRIPFGIGALIVDGMLCYLIVAQLQKALGGPPRLAGLLQAAEYLLLATLLPILVPLALFALLGAALGAVRTRLVTGAWPRNEEFIARQKARGMLGKFGTPRSRREP